MKLKTTLAALSATLAFGAYATEFRSSDVHNSDDYPTVAAVKHMSDLAQAGQRRQALDQGLQQRRAGLGKGNDRPGQDRRAGLHAGEHQPHERHLPQDAGADHALPVPLGRAHAQGARRPGGRRNPQGLRALRLRRSGVLRLGRALDLRQEGREVPRRRQGHEDPRPAVRPVGGPDRRHGRQRHAHADRRGVHGPEDRPDRCRRKQHSLLRRLQALRGREVLQQDRALDGARDAADEQGGVRQAARRRTADDPQGRQGLGGVPAQEVGRAGSQVAGSGQGRRRRDRGGRQGFVPESHGARSTTSSSPRPTCKRLVKAVQDTK